MTYKVLSNINYKNLDQNSLKGFASSLLFVGVSKNSNRDPLIQSIIQTLEKKPSGGLIVRMIKNAIKSINSSNGSEFFIEIPYLKVKNLVLIKQPDVKKDLNAWITFFKKISSKTEQYKKFVEISIAINDDMLDNNHKNLLEIGSRTLEASSYTFHQTKNKTVKKKSLRKVNFISFKNNRKNG